jgi:hypothetical protein
VARKTPPSQPSEEPQRIHVSVPEGRSTDETIRHLMAKVREDFKGSNAMTSIAQSLGTSVSGDKLAKAAAAVFNDPSVERGLLENVREQLRSAGDLQRAVISGASASAARSRAIESARPYYANITTPEERRLRDLHTVVTRLAGISAESAEQLQVVGTASEATVETLTAIATLTAAGQKSQERSNRILIALTVALLIFTVVLVVLTAVLALHG